MKDALICSSSVPLAVASQVKRDRGSLTHVPTDAFHCCAGIYGMIAAEEGGNHPLSRWQVVSKSKTALIKSPSNVESWGV